MSTSKQKLGGSAASVETDQITGDVVITGSIKQAILSSQVLATDANGKIIAGTLIQSMTLAQRNSLAAPYAMQIVYVNDANYYSFYNGTAWVRIQTGNAISAGKVPYGDASGNLTFEDAFSYSTGNLSTGDLGFGGDGGVNLNGGRGRVSASGTGIVIKVSGGSPADSSKAIQFINVTRRWLLLKLPTGDAATTPLEGVANMHWYPEVDETFNLGTSALKWKAVYAKDIIAYGKLNVGAVSEYADNAAAITGGLVAGDVYRTGDNLKIVH